MPKAIQYDASALTLLEGLDPVRKRPGMYTNTERPDDLAREIIDNSADEALAGYANRIEVILHKDGGMTVSDNGRGIPVDKHPEYGIPGVELILTKLHSGGKFSQKLYQFSGGLHGVGISVVNALSRHLHVEIFREGKSYEITFADGKKTQSLRVVKGKSSSETGTQVTFIPDPHYFDHADFSVKALVSLLKAKALLCPGLTTRLYDDRNAQEQVWNYPDGIADYLVHEVGFGLLGTAFSEEHSEDHWSLSWALVMLEEGEGFPTDSYVNLVPTPDGGSHVSGFRSGLLAAVREFCELHDVSLKGLKLQADDVCAQCAYVLSLKWPEPQFAGQTKTRLSSRACAQTVEQCIHDHFSIFLNQDPKRAKQFIDWVIAKAQARLQKSQAPARKKWVGGPALPGKLADCTGSAGVETELFLVEGDSAGGSAKQARDKRFQAVMPLRGKILNAWEVTGAQLLGSQEIRDIITAIGVEPGSSDLSGLRYQKICILADADSDGAHIATLLCALFYRHFPALVAAGHLYVAQPPLYRIDCGKSVYYALNDDIKQQYLSKLSTQRGSVQVQRFKGLGEMNPQQLRETTLAPKTRSLLQLTVAQQAQITEMMNMLLSKKEAQARKAWLEGEG